MSKLITYQYLRQETDISQNVDNKSLDNPIKRAQDMLSFLFGKAFYEQIETQFDSNNLSTDNDALFDPYIKKFLAWQAYEFYLVKANVYETRTGFRQFTDENSEVASDVVMGNIIKDAKQWTQFYKGEMLSYIKQQQRIDSSKYPLYRDCGDKVGSGFHITAITVRDKTNRKINRQTDLNGD